RYVRDKRKSKLILRPKRGLRAAAWLARLRVKHALPRTPVLLPHFDRQALESQFAPLAARVVLRLCYPAQYPTLGELRKNASPERRDIPAHQSSRESQYSTASHPGRLLFRSVFPPTPAWHAEYRRCWRCR